jgi:hypothetical protein
MRLTGWLVVLFLLALAQPVVGVIADDGDDQHSAPGITEGPDPIDGTPSAGSRAASESSEWLPSGSGLGPQWAYLPGTDWPLVVWSHDAGGDHDIAFTEWTGQAWLAAPEFLTSSPADELDPRIHVTPDGSVYVVWWESEAPQSVLLTRRGPGSHDWEPTLVVSQAGRRPSVAVANGRILVAFEQDAPTGGQQVVVATLGADGRALEVVAETERTSALDVVLLTDDGRIRLQWTDAAGGVASSVLRNGEWTAPFRTAAH